MGVLDLGLLWGTSGVPNLFEPVGTFGALTQFSGHSNKMATTGDRVCHKNGCNSLSSVTQ